MGAIASPNMPKNTFLTKKCEISFYFFSVQNLAREAHSGHSEVKSAPPHQDKFLATPMLDRLYDRSTSLRCNGKQNPHSLGPAAAKALLLKLLWVCVTTEM